MSPSRLLLPLVVVAALFGPVGPAGAAQACQAGVGIRLADAPRGTRDPRALAYVVDSVLPGTTIQRKVAVCNGTTDPVTLNFYANAALVEGGQFRIVEGRVANELTSWTHVTPTVSTLLPNQRLLLNVSIAVPSGATGGERYAVVLAELPARAQNGVRVASRVGVRMYLDVRGPKAPRSDFVVDSLQAARGRDGSPVVTALVRNTGERALDMSGSLMLTDGPGGLSGGPFAAQLGTTLGRGETEPVTIPLSKAITGGPWTARLTLRSGLLERRAEASLTFPDAAGAQAPPVKAKAIPLAKDRKILVPLAGGLIFLLALLLLVVGLLTSRRKARS